ncbi:MAG: hypothetical protein ACJAYX_003834 [Planctomycetota bacterium]|jgi:hypothetical protein
MLRRELSSSHRCIRWGPAKSTQSRYGRTFGERYWDDMMWLADVSGQRSGKGGEFAFLYRDAGPVEVRVRHVDGLTTSRAFVVQLPEPSADVVRDFEIPTGEIRGRYPFTKLDGAACKTFTVTLFPSDMTRHDPFFMPHHGSSLARECPKIENSPDGGFAFRYLRSGRWLLRAHHSGDVLLWQKLIDVHNDVVDVGDLPAMQPVAASVQWAFVAEQPVKVLGVWLRVPQAQGQSPIWAGTFSASKGQAVCSVMPGKYLVSAFGWRAVVPDGGDSFGMMSLGLTGELLTEPEPIEVHADGSVTPKSLVFALTKVAGK